MMSTEDQHSHNLRMGMMLFGAFLLMLAGSVLYITLYG
jgi:hypothetical protein